MTARLLILAFLMTDPRFVAGQQVYSDDEGRTAWARLQRQPLTEDTFRQACDLIQDMGQTNLPLASANQQPPMAACAAHQLGQRV